MSMSSLQSDVGRQGKIVVVGIVGACAVLGYVAMTYLAKSSKKQSQISMVQTAGRGTATEESEHYSQVLDQYNRQEAAAAERSGESFLSVMSSRATDVKDQPAQQPQVQQPPQVIYYEAPPPQDPREDEYRSKQISDQTQGLIANWAALPHGAARVSGDGVAYANSIRVADNVEAQKEGAGNPGKEKIVEDFALVPALLETDIDTDENSMVSASIPRGEYAGAKVFAMGYKRLTNTVDMTFTFMKWKGRSFKITAKAVDQTTMRTALSGEVNNRWFSRIVLPALANGIGRTGQLFERSQAQNIITPLGGVVQTYPTTPRASAVAGTIVGGMANQAGQVLANDAANLPAKQVLIPKGTTIGIQFIGPVLASDDVAAGAKGPSEEGADLNALGEPASKPPRQNFPQVPSGYGGGYVPGYTPGYYPQPYMQPGYGYPRY